MQHYKIHSAPYSLVSLRFYLDTHSQTSLGVRVFCHTVKGFALSVSLLSTPQCWVNIDSTLGLVRKQHLSVWEESNKKRERERSKYARIASMGKNWEVPPGLYPRDSWE